MFEMKVRVVFILSILLSLQVAAQRWNIIPAPQQITYTGGYYNVTENDNDPAASPDIKQCVVYDSLLGEEGYILEVDTTRIKVSANTIKGLMYAIITLRQVMITDSATGHLLIPCAKVVDYPKYAYRGMHLDVSRHFFSVEVIKRYLDELARLKYNYFHWHLTDDQGWRIEIKKYPLLTGVGAWRTEKDGTKHGGFYTQEEIREIIAYSANLNITVVPELDLPGHASAAIAAYPELSCHGRKIEVPNKWGIMQDVFCPTDSTIIFLKMF
jgi:hexosaminidase